MGLDINTPKGQETLEQERRAISIACAHLGWQFFETKKDSASVADGFFSKGCQIKAIVEVKCRKLTYEKLFGPYRGEWIITNEKIEAVTSIANALCTSSIFLLYLVPDDLVLLKVMSHPKSEKFPNGYMARYDIMESVTQRTCNGGTISRMNGFVPMQDAKLIRP